MADQNTLVRNRVVVDLVAKKGDGGGGNMDDMEARLSEVEKAIIRIDGALERLETNAARLTSDVANFKWQLLGAVVAVWLGVWGSSIAIQQMTVASFQAAGEQARSQVPTAAAAPAPQPIIINVPPQAAAPPAPAASRP